MGVQGHAVPVVAVLVFKVNKTALLQWALEADDPQVRVVAPLLVHQARQKGVGRLPLVLDPLGVPQACWGEVLPACLQVVPLAVAASTLAQGLVMHQASAPTDLGLGHRSGLVGNGGLQQAGVCCAEGVVLMLLDVGLQAPALQPLAGQALPAQ